MKKLKAAVNIEGPPTGQVAAIDVTIAVVLDHSFEGGWTPPDGVLEIPQHLARHDVVSEVVSGTWKLMINPDAPLDIIGEFWQGGRVASIYFGPFEGSWTGVDLVRLAIFQTSSGDLLSIGPVIRLLDTESISLSGEMGGSLLQSYP